MILPVLYGNQVFPDDAPPTPKEITEALENLAKKDSLASTIWKITKKYSIFNPNKTDDKCLEEVLVDNTLLCPYLVNVTLNDSKTFMDNFTESEFFQTRINELSHALELFENHTQISQDQNEYYSAITRVTKKLGMKFNDSYLCPPGSTCGCIKIQIMHNYEMELSRFMINEYALWEFIIFGTYIDPIFRIFMISFGLLLNGTLIYIFIKESSVRRESNILVFNLIINNLITLLVHIPMHYVYDSHHSVLAYKIAFYLIQIIVISVSATTVLVLNIQRFVDVSRVLAPPVSSLKLESRGRAIVYFATVWIWTLLITSLIGMADERDILILEFILYLGIYLFIYAILHAVFSALTSRKLQRAAERGNTTSDLHYITSSSITVSFILAFYIIHLPFFFFLPFERSELERGIQYFLPTVVRILDFLFHQLLFMYPSVNAIILYKASSEFRRYFQKYLCRCWHKADDGQYLTMSSLQHADT